MASGQTKTYGFNQWQPEDKVLREEFNGDNEKMEQALTGLDGRVEGKAEQTEVDGLKTQLATKAAQSALDSLSASVTGGLARKYGTDNPYINAGSYIGDGTATRTISIGFQPFLVVVFSLDAEGSYDYSFLLGDGSAQIACEQRSIHLVTDYLKVTSTGFIVNYQPSNIKAYNVSGWNYHYIAFR